MAKIEGLALLQAKMRAIPVEVRAEVRPAIRDGAEELVSRILPLVPVEIGAGAHAKQGLPAGALKGSVEWHWFGVLGATITAQPAQMKNLGLWVEKGTAAAGAEVPRLFKRGQKAGSRYFGRITKGKKAHHATKAEPFFGPIWRAYGPEFQGWINIAFKNALDKVKNRTS